ncbi:MAG: hypothetical protein PHS33_09515 [Candidatus Omnitrophica bacterium]|nr:hypothetical protein [Candidatus Omnitrophota bacterium]
MDTNKIIETLARWLDDLNSWRWPKDMPFKPIGYDELPMFSKDKKARTKYRTQKTIFIFLLHIIGDKESLRYHWIHNLHKSNFQFELWYKDKMPIFPEIKPVIKRKNQYA